MKGRDDRKKKKRKEEREGEREKLETKQTNYFYGTLRRLGLVNNNNYEATFEDQLHPRPTNPRPPRPHVDIPPPTASLGNHVTPPRDTTLGYWLPVSNNPFTGLISAEQLDVSAPNPISHPLNQMTISGRFQSGEKGIVTCF